MIVLLCRVGHHCSWGVAAGSRTTASRHDGWVRHGLVGEVLAELAAPELAGQPLLAEWRAFVTAHRDAALLKHRGRAHLTASCFVFDQDLERIALTFHRRGQF